MPLSQRYSQEALAATVGVPARRIELWIKQNLIPYAHNSSRRRGGNRWAYYDDSHVRAIRALLAIRDNNTRLADLGPFLREEGISIVDYARARGLL